ncbi:YhbP family protein [Serratia symbiotica]|uniref:Putative UPF0306 protein YhbP n=1 Tax=Serratia symbiotica SCt-VLC TaxID=1347341 RepID=A0A068RB31_9GAMM|nr:YhbP family protein [Serratia symbiotica]CDG47640.1 Putative UPF0306 protein YhbP [Serratia symbiotica SCt-VLC]
MSTDLEHIRQFICKQHLLTICASSGAKMCGTGSGMMDMWCANCFYVFDAELMALWLMTETHTRHGALMLENSRVVGTIAPKPKAIALICGVQYRAEAVLLSGDGETLARTRYGKRFPIARTMPAPMWRLDLQEVKMTDNSLGFGTKLHWVCA